MIEVLDEKITVSGLPENVKEIEKLEADLFRLLVKMSDESYMELIAELKLGNDPKPFVDFRPSILDKYTLHHIHKMVSMTLVQNQLYERKFKTKER